MQVVRRKEWLAGGDDRSTSRLNTTSSMSDWKILHAAAFNNGEYITSCQTLFRQIWLHNMTSRKCDQILCRCGQKCKENENLAGLRDYLLSTTCIFKICIVMPHDAERCLTWDEQIGAVLGGAVLCEDSKCVETLVVLGQVRQSQRGCTATHRHHCQLTVFQHFIFQRCKRRWGMTKIKFNQMLMLQENYKQETE